MTNPAAKPGALHLIPVPLGDADPHLTLSGSAIEAARTLDYFLAENAKSARQFLKLIAHPRPLREISIECFDKDSDRARAAELLKPLLDGRSAGVLSEAGSPAIADPGSLLVAAAHRGKIRVVPHSGPSAIMLALMASGFNGQHFEFHGYLPVGRDELKQALVTLERASRERDITQIFIETPYRNDQLLATLCDSCKADTRLCVASDLTLPGEFISSMAIADWRTARLEIGRRPAVFLLYAR